MAKGICPTWVGYFLISPLRRIFENPENIFDQLVREEMVVLEPGCGMGFFTLPLARKVGAAGKVIAIDVQPGMLAALTRRAGKAGLLDRIEIRRAGSDRLGIEDLAGTIDFAAAIHMVHEVPNPAAFFSEIRTALKPGGKMLLIEPKGHVDQTRFNQTVGLAEHIGFKPIAESSKSSARRCLLQKK